MQEYNQTTPPAYSLKNIKGVPIAIFGGLDDPLATAADTDWLNEQLGENVVYYKKLPGITHLTYVLGKDMSYMSSELIPLLSQYNNMPVTQVI